MRDLGIDREGTKGPKQLQDGVKMVGRWTSWKLNLSLEKEMPSPIWISKTADVTSIT